MLQVDVRWCATFSPIKIRQKARLPDNTLDTPCQRVVPTTLNPAEPGKMNSEVVNTYITCVPRQYQEYHFTELSIKQPGGPEH